MSDQELDDLFKEASAKYEVPFDDKDWDKMAALLDKPASPKPGFWNWKTISGIALLLIISGLVIITQWDHSNGGVEKDSQANNLKASSKDALILGKESEAEPLQTNEKEVSVDSTVKNTREDHVEEVSKEADSKLSSSQADLTHSVTTTSAITSSESRTKSQSSAVKRNRAANNTTAQLKTKALRENELAVAEKGDGKVNANDKAIPFVDATADKRKDDARVDKNADKENSNSILPAKAAQQLNDKNKAIAATRTVHANEKDEDALKANVQTKKEQAKQNDPIASNEYEANESGSPLTGSTAISQTPVAEQEHPVTLKEAGKLSAEKQSDLAALSSATASDKQIAQQKFSDSLVVATSPKKDSVINKAITNKEGEKKIDSVTKISRLSVKLALSPDFSSIGYFKPGKPGFNYGLLAEYTISRHWSVTLGGIWSKKSYDDTQTENLGYGAVNSTYINGSCRVLDLPLNINYYLTPQNTFSLYGSIGLSSYFMFDEDYTYDYVYGTKQYSYSKKVDRGNTEWFRMMNLSIGIQQQLSARMRLQLEPFIKAPLSGIGGGDLKLVSSGVFLNIKYTFK